MARARMVAVVVPSPATSDVLEATTLTSLAPMFSNGSASSISLATETPSLVTSGPPNDLLKMTLRPVGPSVVPTAWASVSTPSSILRRAASAKRSCLAKRGSLLLSCRVGRVFEAHQRKWLGGGGTRRLGPPYEWLIGS